MDIQKLKDINENKLEFYKQLIQEDRREDYEKELEIHTRLKKILDGDEAVFFKISMEDSLRILSKLLPEEDLLKAYSELISGNNFEDLRKKSKL